MQDIYLTFQDEIEANSVLFTNNLSNYKNIDVLGIVYQRPPNPTPEDYVFIPYPAPNFGVNIRLLDGEDITPLQPYIVNIVDPIRMWA
jgi:hypothetical protein